MFAACARPIVDSNHTTLEMHAAVSFAAPNLRPSSSKAILGQDNEYIKINLLALSCRRRTDGHVDEFVASQAACMHTYVPVLYAHLI